MKLSCLCHSCGSKPYHMVSTVAGALLVLNHSGGHAGHDGVKYRHLLQSSQRRLARLVPHRAMVHSFTTSLAASVTQDIAILMVVVQENSALGNTQARRQSTVSAGPSPSRKQAILLCRVGTRCQNLTWAHLSKETCPIGPSTANQFCHMRRCGSTLCQRTAAPFCGKGSPADGGL